mmetsp:Transcript_35542/g.100611  ORF Transcript_35542/g.100611 Transcript_35542/m.100611 type:complete len:96 (+) Transcript_35542:358-645(+)
MRQKGCGGKQSHGQKLGGCGGASLEALCYTSVDGVQPKGAPPGPGVSRRGCEASTLPSGSEECCGGHRSLARISCTKKMGRWWAGCVPKGGVVDG